MLIVTYMRLLRCITFWPIWIFKIHLNFKLNPPLLIDAGQFEGNSCVVWANTATQKIRTSDVWDTMVALKDVLVLAEMKDFDLCRVNEWLFHGTLTLQSMDTFTS